MTEDFTFLSGVELEDGSLFIAAQNNKFDIQDNPHTIFLKRTSDGIWRNSAHTSWVTTSVSYNADKDGIFLISPAGSNVSLRLKGYKSSKVFDTVEKPRRPPVMRFSKSIDGSLYIGGTNRFIYRETNEGWEELSNKDMKTAPPKLKSFEGIAGFNEEELYAFGWGGVIWTNESGKWKSVESKTDRILNDGDVLGDSVYIGCQLGIILKGRGSKWTRVKNSVLPQDIWSVRAFNGAVYFATMSGILELKNSKLSLIKALDEVISTTMELFVGPSGLWSVGSSDIAVFDGNKWESITKSTIEIGE